ncbi:nitrile hydratase accessory protein [Gellertiella hungarica]|uniref:Nitrile hydratase accessory protein n=1 Tax=Gellertiella hungarica TaxID=1572859 RepID=A0A7W6NJC8_9HYPH|nr:nitrile hydratase accessory protein [Gellertiella hungarica]MBB4063608.1 nitrile hydratase accessory protein [Gellertiella hungarica]
MSVCETASPLVQSPGLPKSAEGDPVFAEPWHATAFALTVLLHQKGLFAWSEWAETLSREVKKPGRAQDGSDYFDAWVEALSALLASKGVADAAGLLDLQKSWQRAAEATPHGTPIRLENDPQRQSL